MFLLNSQLHFPPVHTANDEGILAIGGDLSTERLLLAYRSGIFPWYNVEEPIIWWSPNPRCILFPEQVKVSSSMQTLLKKGVFRFTVNHAFEAVIENCKHINTVKHKDTWINNDIIDAYTTLHSLGHAHSAEAWLNGELVGGLYGIKIGQVFFGESMFSKLSNASKFTFINYVRQLQKEGVVLIDCQVATSHLQSLGATLLERTEFIKLLNKYC